MAQAPAEAPLGLSQLMRSIDMSFVRITMMGGVSREVVFDLGRFGKFHFGAKLAAWGCPPCLFGAFLLRRRVARGRAPRVCDTSTVL
jgi:hypothetical protein